MGLLSWCMKSYALHVQHISENMVQKFPMRAIVRVADVIFDKMFLSLASNQKFHLVLHPIFYDFQIPDIFQSSLAREHGLLTDTSQWSWVSRPYNGLQ